MTYPQLTAHIKPIIIATQNMDFETIFREMDQIQKINNTKVVSGTRKVFEALSKIPEEMKQYDRKEQAFREDMAQIDSKLRGMRIDIEGFLRKAATIKIFCGSLKGKDKSKPDFRLDSGGGDSTFIKVTGSYSHQKGFEIVQ